MGDNAKIEWTDATWNPVTGCTKVSQGCKHCYAEREWPRLTKLVPAYAGRDFSDVRTHADRISQPIRWAKPRRVFVNSMSDLFHEDVSDDFIDQVFGVMWACLYGRNEQPGHVFQVLTKRAERMRDYLSTDRREEWAQAAVNYGGGIDPDGIYDQTLYFDGPHPRIWLGVSIEDQATADERIPLLKKTPAAVRWISAEPLLGQVDLSRWVFDREKAIRNCMNGPAACNWDQADSSVPYPLNWVVVGGESGPNARPMHPQWARDLHDQCAAAGVPFLFKQWGEWLPFGQSGFTAWSAAMTKNGNIVKLRGCDWPGIAHFNDGAGGRETHRIGPIETRNVYSKDEWPTQCVKIGKGRAGRLLDGVRHDGYPEAKV